MNVFPLSLWSQRNGKTKKRVISGKKIGLALTLRWNGELDMRDWQQQQRITGPHVSYVVSCAVPRVTRDYGFSAGMWFLEWLGKCIALSLSLCVLIITIFTFDYGMHIWLRRHGSLALGSEVVGPRVSHVCSVEPAWVEEEWIKTTGQAHAHSISVLVAWKINIIRVYCVLSCQPPLKE